MSRSKHEYNEKPSNRDFATEARNLIRGLRGSDLYHLYEIVIERLKRSNNETRDCELNAVKTEIERDRTLDESRLTSIKRGYKSEMAANAKPADGYTAPAKKKV